MTNPLNDVSTWLYHIGGMPAPRINWIGNMRVDLVVVDREDNDLEPFTVDDVERMRGVNDKLVISYLSIGEAETYRDYWQSSWEDTPPDWLGEENPEWEGNINIKYWDPDWQNIVFEMVDDAVEAGFNGLYLDLIGAYSYWEDERPGAPEGLFRDRMVTFVEAIRARAQDKLADMGEAERAFAIIGQNGEDLAEDPDYLAAVDGIGKEDLYFYYPNGEPDTFGPVPNGWLTGSKELLEMAAAADVKTLAVEYVPLGELAGVMAALQREIKYLNTTLEAPLYLASGRELDQVYTMIDLKGNARQWGSETSDTLKGTGFRDAIKGYGGDDVLSGRSGRDRLFGNEGDDTLRGGAANDKLRGGSDNDLLRGQNGNDRLFGGADNDRMFGGAGRDLLVGGPGNDKANGGAGADRFVFREGDGRLVVRDFGWGADTMDVRDFGLAGLGELKANADEIGTRLVIHLGDDTLVLKDMTKADLAAEDFLF